MKIAVSACLLGAITKYNGGNNYSSKLEKLLKGHEVISLCPEVMGGLPTPRDPAEIVAGKVLTKEGRSVDKEFRRGAEKSLDIVNESGVELAILKSKSPSCGVGQIYDGSFSGRLVDGDGIFARLLKKEGIRVINIDEFLKI